MSEFINSQENNKNRKISEVESTSFSSSLIRSKEELNKIVEEPLRAACQILYDKNIQTVASTANAKDLKEIIAKASICIDYDSLSEENRKITENLGLKPVSYNDFHTIEITVPMSKDSTVEEISSATQNIAEKFLAQSPDWLPKYSIEDLKKQYGYNENEDVPPQNFIEEGYYYDPEHQIFYASEDHFKKVKSWETQEQKS